VSSASPDFYGGDRVGDNLYSNSLVALRATTGARVWHFQIQHHDIWDYDLPAPPVLVQVRRNVALVDAVVQVTKTGLVFVLNRDTGVPIFPVEERAVPSSDVPGEVSSPTQPFPTRPPPLLRLELGPGDLWDVDPKHDRRCREWLGRLRNEGVFTPPSLRGTLMHPYTGGGANWSGAAYDPIARRIFVPVGNDAGAVALSPVPGDARDTGRRPYSDVFGALFWYLRGTGTGLRYRLAPQERRDFAIDGRPCNRPPWGLLVAVGLDEGVIEWSVPTGEENGIHGLFPFGPALATAGGLVFHAGTRDLHLRVHDAKTGAVIHQIPLPAGLHSGPISYRIGNGPQWITVAAGGHPALGSKLGDYVIAYRLRAKR
jgi:quinoprotein glucose dehydrogenase